MTKSEWHIRHLNIRTSFVIRHSCFVIVPHLSIKGYRLKLKGAVSLASHGSVHLSFHQSAMDESGA
jgi:hypothetical protein